MGVTCFLLLSCLGLAITAQAQNCSRPVPGPNMDLKGEDILLQTFPDGTKVTFACNIGYTSAGGSAVITCTAGSWSPVRLICEMVTCDPPPAVVDGTFTPQKESYGYSEVVQYSCQNDYSLNGSKSVSCSDDGTFNPGPPTCVMVQCKEPNIENAEWIGGSRPPYRHQATVTYRCRSGYTMIGASTQICDINSQWSPGLPQCQLVQCKDPDIENGEWIGSSRPPYRHQATVTYRCRSGFTMIGASTQICDINSQWSPGLPQCQMVQCKDPDIENGEWIGGSRPPYRHQATVTYRCRSGYTMIGASTQICDINSQWSPGLPQCQLVQCKEPDIENGPEEGASPGGSLPAEE